MANQTPPKRGRPPKDPDRLLRTVNLRLSQGMLAEIEAVHAKRGDDTDLADVLRELLRVGLDYERRS